jgi:hypothetical protein
MKMRGIFWLADLLPASQEVLDRATAQVVGYNLENSVTWV